MANKKTLGYVAIALAALLAIYAIVGYNGFVKKDEKVKLQWNEVQNAYQRRSDLIPSLVNTVKGGASFEQTTLQQVTEARAKAGQVTVSSDLSAEQYNRQTAAQDELAGVTNRLLITVERYPELQGAKAFRDLQVQLEGTERRIKIARKDFNAAIQDYNSSVRGFPSALFAGIFGFKPKTGFQSDTGADKAVEINFNK